MVAISNSPQVARMAVCRTTGTTLQAKEKTLSLWEVAKNPKMESNKTKGKTGVNLDRYSLHTMHHWALYWWFVCGQADNGDSSGS